MKSPKCSEVRYPPVVNYMLYLPCQTLTLAKHCLQPKFPLDLDISSSVGEKYGWGHSHSCCCAHKPQSHLHYSPNNTRLEQPEDHSRHAAGQACHQAALWRTYSHIYYIYRLYSQAKIISSEPCSWLAAEQELYQGANRSSSAGYLEKADPSPSCWQNRMGWAKGLTVSVLEKRHL